MKYSHTENPFKEGDCIKTIPILCDSKTDFIVVLSYEAGLLVRTKDSSDVTFVFWSEIIGLSKESSFSDDEWE